MDMSQGIFCDTIQTATAFIQQVQKSEGLGKAFSMVNTGEDKCYMFLGVITSAEKVAVATIDGDGGKVRYDIILLTFLDGVQKYSWKRVPEREV